MTVQRTTEPTILVFGAFHYDVSYMETFEGSLPKAFGILDAALDRLEEAPDFVFCVEQVILMDAYWSRRPERHAALRRFARAGRLIFCPGMWTMPDANIPNAESYYRNALLGRHWLREHLDVAPGPICWMADVFGHHAQWPQICRQLGYPLYMFQRGQLENETTTEFLWEGIDGTRIRAHWEADSYYGFNLGLAWLDYRRPDEWIAERIRKLVVEPLQGDGRPMLLSKIGGDFLVPERKHMDFVRRWNDRRWGPPVVFGGPDRYLAQAPPQCPVKVLRADLNPLMQGAYSSRIRLKQLCRRAEALLQALEALDAALLRGDPVDTQPLWRRLTTLQFHDTICGTLADRPWKEALAAATQLREDLQTALRQAPAPGEGTLLFNPLPYRRIELIESSAAPRLVELEAMQLVPAERARALSDFTPVETRGQVIRNGFLRAEVDDLGRLACLTDLVSGHEYRDARFGYLHDLFSQPDWGDLWSPARVNSSLLHVAPWSDPAPVSGAEVTPHGLCEKRGADSQCFAPPAIEVQESAERGAIRCRHEESGLVVSYVLQAGERLLRIRAEITPKAPQQRVRAVIAPGIIGGVIRREIPAGWVAQPEGEYPAQNWMDYANDRKGLCLVNRGLPGNNVTDGVMMLTLFRSVAMIEPGVMPDFEIGVAQRADYALCPFVPGDAGYDPTRLGRLFNQPVETLEGVASSSNAPLRLSLEGTAEILSLRRVAQNKAEVRLHESSGRPARIMLCWSRPLSQAHEVTPYGEVIRGVPASRQDTLELSLRAFEIATFRVELA